MVEIGPKSWFFAHVESFFVYALLLPMSCAPRLKDFEKFEFLQRIFAVPKVWVFGPTLTPIYSLNMTKNTKIGIALSK